METKLTAQQPPEEPRRADELVQQTAAPPAAHAHPTDTWREPEPLMTARDVAMATVGELAADSAMQAFEAHEKKFLAGGASADDAATAAGQLTPVCVLLTGRHVAYLQQRAAMHGETPEQHLEAILRQFQAYYDDKKPELTAMEAQRNGGAVTRRVA
ncbi:hypothetical protein GXW78_16910 [Roseomonas terrae]|uniref:Uncharacterized protein n=1 Tax=Neoroseomonas terrae TaxID=424799 RepID=A0ABS5EK00_9PROT|nr:hypothetical protein [Neoroseomonas terrae]MBR0651356.1 hypothetical protein [Neoroseomonas terrae]